jgi:predicted transcriptional regulator of viral defense system
MEILKSGLGKETAGLLSTLANQGKYVFTAKDFFQLYPGKRQSMLKLLHELVKRKWLKRLEKGKYLLLPLEAGAEGRYTEHEFIIACKLVDPSYISFWSALNFYGYTEQVPKTVFIATPKRKRPLEIGRVKYQFVRLPKRKFFGYKKEWIEGKPFWIAEKEKLILDCLDYLPHSGGTVEVVKGLEAAKGDLSFTKLVRYGKRMGNRAVFQRLGFLLEFLGIGDKKTLLVIQKNISRSYAVLDTLVPPQGKFIERWKIRVNIPLESLTEWKTH